MYVAERPLPKLDALNAPYFKAAAEGRFKLQRCSRCGRYVYYPRVACPHCLATDSLVWEDVSGEGLVYSFALIHRPQHPAFFEEVPIALAVVQLNEGPQLISSIVNCPPEALHIGMQVCVAPVKIAPEIGLPKFEPAPAQ